MKHKKRLKGLFQGDGCFGDVAVGFLEELGFFDCRAHSVHTDIEVSLQGKGEFRSLALTLPKGRWDGRVRGPSPTQDQAVGRVKNCTRAAQLGERTWDAVCQGLLNFTVRYP